MFRKEFPITKNHAYFNTAYVGMMSRSLIKYRSQYDHQLFKSIWDYKSKSDTLLSETRKLASQLIGSDNDKTLITNSLSSGIRFALDCLSQQSKVLILEDDYPSLTKAVDERNFQITKMPITHDLEQKMVQEIGKRKIDVLLLSVVQYISGLKVDFEHLKKIKQEHPNLLILGDATQFVGTELFEMNDSPFDVMALSSYKWLLAGFGSGVLCFSDHFLNKTKTSLRELESTVQVGHVNLGAVSSLKFAIEKLFEWDYEKLMDKKNQVCQYLKHKLSELELLDEMGQKRKNHSSIFNLKLDPLFHKKLKEKGIQTSLRGNGIRVSVHFYNTPKDVDLLMKTIQRARLTV
ncbi:MAG: aminotransferase class V-fold PLP-dependent enzyme [Flavobacteriaceae bacterium]|nr:aminotransferase class V-fold PLP-dependent enzyme [Flavobacteriaceae bacterium]